MAASLIFKFVDGAIDLVADPTEHNTYYGKNGVAWVLRFGGLCTLVSDSHSQKFEALNKKQLGAIVSRGVSQRLTT